MRNILVFFVLALLLTVSSFGQTCIKATPTLLFDTSRSCSSEPAVDKAFGTHIFEWRGKPFMILVRGNEFTFFNITNPAAPKGGSASYFHVGNMGDSDYDLLNLSVCDDCRWGVANYKMAGVLFELSDDATRGPVVKSFYINPNANYTEGSFTFTHNGAQYLITESAWDSEHRCGNNSTAFKIDGITQADLTFVDCVEVAGLTTSIVGGIYYDGYLYLADRSTRVYLFSLSGSGTTLQLTHVKTPWLGFSIRDKSWDIDPVHKIAVSANTSAVGVDIWDVTNPANPVKAGNISGYYNRASIGYPLLFLARKGYRGSEAVHRLDLPGYPEVHPAFWDEDNAWNWPYPAQGYQCSEVQAGRFSPDGTNLYVPRFSRVQRFDVSSCVANPTPTPTPTPVLPTPTPTAVGDPCEKPWDHIFSNGFENGCASVGCVCPTCPPCPSQ